MHTVFLISRIVLTYTVFILLKILYIYLFWEGKRGRKTGRETWMCGCPLCTPYWGPGPQPRHMRWLGIEPVTLCFTVCSSIHWATPARANTAFWIQWSHRGLERSLLCSWAVTCTWPCCAVLSSIHLTRNRQEVLHGLVTWSRFMTYLSMSFTYQSGLLFQTKQSPRQLGSNFIFPVNQVIAFLSLIRRRSRVNKGLRTNRLQTTSPKASAFCLELNVRASEDRPRANSTQELATVLQNLRWQVRSAELQFIGLFLPHKML